MNLKSKILLFVAFLSIIIGATYSVAFGMRGSFDDKEEERQMFRECLIEEVFDSRSPGASPWYTRCIGSQTRYVPGYCGLTHKYSERIILGGDKSQADLVARASIQGLLNYQLGEAVVTVDARRVSELLDKGASCTAPIGTTGFYNGWTARSILLDVEKRILYQLQIVPGQLPYMVTQELNRSILEDLEKIHLMFECGTTF